MVYNADSHFATLIAGLPNNVIEDVTLNNIRIWYRPMDSATSKIQTVVPEHEKTYPEPQKMGVMPAYGFFIRHAKNIALNNVEIRYTGSEIRPPFYVEDVDGFELRNVKPQPVKDAKRVVMKNVSRLLIKDSEGLKDAEVKRIEAATF